MKMAIKVAFYKIKSGKIPEIKKFSENYELLFAFAYIKSYIDKYLPGVAEFEIINDINELESDKFDIIGFSSYTDCFNEVEELAKSAKEINPKIFTIVGSYHISALPHTLPPSVDCGVIGEGEETFKELLEVMAGEKSRPFPTDNLKKINGLIFREKGNLVITPNRDPIEPLDKIPPPDRNIINLSPSSLIKESIASSRGCPYNCKFCAGNVLWGCVKYRYFGANYIISEIESILNSSPKITHIPILDSLFITNKARLYEIVKAIENRRINKKVMFSVSLRPDNINHEICKILDKMNVRLINMGIESASLKILNIMNKQSNPRINQSALDMIYKYNISSNCTFILGTPGETLEDIYKTFDFILTNKTKISNIGISVLTPFPGTYYWEMAKEKGLVNDYMDFGKLSEIAAPNMPLVCNVDKWRKFREGYAVYLNNENVEESKFYDLLEQFFKELTP